MSARVTEAHERKAQELWSENSGSAWLQDGVITPKLIPAIAQALADAEAAEREGIARVLEGLAEHTLAATVRSRGAS